MRTEDILGIAGRAHCRRQELEELLRTTPNLFPNGSDDSFYATEMALCDAMLGICRALLVPNLLVLSFDAQGRPQAITPPGAA